MAEIGVNYAFAVIGNTNPLPIKCSKFGLNFFFRQGKFVFLQNCSVLWTSNTNVQCWPSARSSSTCTRYHFVRIHRAPIKGLLPVVVCTSIQSLRWPLSSRTYSKMIEKRSRKKLSKTDWQETSLPNKTWFDS